MARKQRLDVDYFPHFIKQGKRMGYIEKKYKNDGYATWWKLLEELGKNDNHFIDISDKTKVMLLAGQCNITETLFLEILQDLIQLDVFDLQLASQGILFSEEFVENIKDAYTKRQNAVITLDGLVSYLLSINRIKPYKRVESGGGNDQKGGINPQTKLEDTKGNNTNLNKKENLIISYFFKVGIVVHKEKVSDYFLRNNQIFYDQWIYNKKEHDPKLVLEAMDIEYNGYNFSDDNHIQNTFKSIWKDFKPSKNNSKNISDYDSQANTPV